MHALVMLAVVAVAPAGSTAARADDSASPAPHGAASSGPSVGPPPVALPRSWGTPRSWFDGTRQRKVWADPLTLAELAPDAAFAEALKAADPTAKVLGERARVRLWSVSDAAAVRAKLAPSLSARALIVWRDAPSAHAAERVAAGGLVLSFTPALEGSALSTWLAARGLTLAQGLGPGLVVVDCAPGDAGFALAERLSKEPGVSLAMPNWWRVGHPR